jgi:hypothetical protein
MTGAGLEATSVFPKGEGEANVGLGAVYDHGDQRRPVEYLNDFVRWRFPGADVLESVAGGVPLSGIMCRLSAAGMVLVGDRWPTGDQRGILNGMVRIAGNHKLRPKATFRRKRCASMILRSKTLGPVENCKEYLRKCSNAGYDVPDSESREVEKYRPRP